MEFIPKRSEESLPSSMPPRDSLKASVVLPTSTDCSIPSRRWRAVPFASLVVKRFCRWFASALQLRPPVTFPLFPVT